MKRPYLHLGGIPAAFVLLTVAQMAGGSLQGQESSTSLNGVTVTTSGDPVAGTQVTVHNEADGSDHSVVSGKDGTFLVRNLAPDRYRVTATKQGYSDLAPVYVDLAPQQIAQTQIKLVAASDQPDASKPAPNNSTPTGSTPVTPVQQNVAAPGFFKRLSQAYVTDWKGAPVTNTTPDNANVAPTFRGYPAPVDGPPFPFGVWPYGGSVTIGQPWTQAGPLMTALWSGPHGDAWKRSGIQIYGWFNFGGNLSSSSKGGYSNFPVAYAERANTVEPDQEVLYIERQPDTVQTDHIDWGFRLTLLYGIDYRFTTAKGILSNQLLGKNQEYGFDPVMAYFDLYVPQVAQGMDIRIGRYISLPDIEAQLAPNNYTYTHSLLYSYDAYTQEGINATIKLSDHWMYQIGLSPGNDVAPWTPDAQLTVNTCLSYTWQTGWSNIYACANSINKGNYSYNNLQAYYLTYYHKFNKNWHEATEAWYQYEKNTPNTLNPAASSLLETGANGAACNNVSALTCFAPEWSVVNYTERQFSKHDYMSIRNEFFDDIVGQRTGVKTRYSEHLIGWGHWIGTTVLLRPELRFDHSYEVPAYDNGTRYSQLVLAGDVIFFF